MALLQASGLSKQYGRRVVVNGVDIDIDAGEIVGLLGPNGAGKTTTFRMVVGMISPKSGEVSFAGRDITHLAMYQRARLGLGYLAQDSSVFRKLTVEQNLFAILELMTTRRGRPFRSTYRGRRKRVDELLEQFHISHLRKSIAMTLSGGERRRLEIARCLVSEPLLIMLDEPFTGIDPKTVADIQGIIQELREHGIGVLITDHHVRETLKIMNRGYIIAQGTVLTAGNPKEIIAHPKVRELYLGQNFEDIDLEEKKPAPAVDAPQANGFETHHTLSATASARELIGALVSDSAPVAADRLAQMGPSVVVDLMQAMQWQPPPIRERAHIILCQISRLNLPFDPAANDTQRLMQLVVIREQLEQVFPTLTR